LTPRERLGLGLAAAALLVGGVLGGLVRPAWKRLQAAPAQQARLDTEWQTMQALAAQARQLQGHPPRPRDERLNALDTATRRHLGAGASVKLIQDEVTVQLPPTAATALAQWLAEVRVNAQLTPTVVRIHRAGVSAAGGEAAVLWQGSVQFNLGG
jgi:general secretion pathway protein M